MMFLRSTSCGTSDSMEGAEWKEDCEVLDGGEGGRSSMNTFGGSRPTRYVRVCTTYSTHEYAMQTNGKEANFDKAIGIVIQKVADREVEIRRPVALFLKFIDRHVDIRDRFLLVFASQGYNVQIVRVSVNYIDRASRWW